MNDIAIVSVQKSHGDFLKNDLEKYFKNYAKISSYTVDDIDLIDKLEEKCIIITTFDIFQKVRNKVNKDSEIIMSKLTIRKENVNKISQIPKNSKVLVININYRLCMEVISLLFACGYKDYEFIPYYDILEECNPDIEIAITPNELDIIPKGIKKIVNIGERVCNVSFILEIAHILKLNNFTNDAYINKLLHNIEAADFSIETLLGEKDDLNIQINVLLEMMSQGIIITDVSGSIMSCNSKALELLNEKTNHLEGFNISDIITELDNIKSTRINKKAEKIINLYGKNIIITFNPFIKDNITSGFVITLDNFEEIEEKQNDIRTKISLGNHKAKYTFESIKGNSHVINNVIRNAKMMANSNSSVVIIGESGTGKEIFAQSMHNESPRNKHNFVAVNCAAIPENLLESEMFGYEEGAFTGAKKGGKIGYFELAHNGTLFLDEIAEMPLLMQSKLLRAIEEMKIVKIGSNKLITVDVRIIAATNKNLKKYVEEGKFREDLYYRLNVLPLNIPSLRERKEDILIIANYLIQTMGKNISFSSEAEKLMNAYNWKGNIRELRNVIEYIISLGINIIKKEDLPFSTQVESLSRDSEKTDNKYHNDIIMKFILKEGSKIELFKMILNELEKSYYNKERMGRVKLMNVFESYGEFYSEQEIRTCLIRLDDYGFISSKKGRAGSIITTSGIQLKNKIIELIG